MLSVLIVLVVVVVLIGFVIGVLADSSPNPTPPRVQAPTPAPAPAFRPVASPPVVKRKPPTPVVRKVTPPQPAPARTTAPSLIALAECELEVSKALTQLERWGTPLGRELWTAHDRRADWQHDLTTMRQRRDLSYVRLELLDANNTVLHAFELKFDQQRVSPQSIQDAAQGVEIPVLPPAERQRIKSHRLLINSSSQRATFQKLLRLNWTTAATLSNADQSGFESVHARKITGGRLTGQVRVAQSAMQTLVITNAGQLGYAFGRSLDEPSLTNVFLHVDDAAKGITFVPGQRVRALVIQTPRGPQGRSIQLAT